MKTKHLLIAPVLGAVLIAVAALVGVGVLQWPMLVVLIVLVPISIARVWRTA